MKLYRKHLLNYAALSAGLFVNDSISAQQPDILIIMTDQQSADAMSHVIGRKYLNTPNMDKLAQQGISFTNAYCANPLSMPSRSSMFTGMYPHQLGIQTNDHVPIDPKNTPCMGTIFSENGYETGYFGKWHLPYPGNDQTTHGFQYRAQIAGKGVDHLIPDAVIEFMNRERQKPYLAVASFCNPHNICEWARGDELPDGDIGNPPSLNDCPPLPVNHYPSADETDIMRDMRTSIQANPQFPVGDFDEKKWREYRWAYFRMIEKVDREIGKILDALKKNGKDKNTLIVFLSDHGDMQGAHKWNQKTVFFEESTRVPFIICPPGQTSPMQSALLIQTGIDLIPTLCAYAGIRPSTHLPGKSIPEMLENKRQQRDYIVVSDKFFQGKNIFKDKETFTPEGRMVRSHKYKYWIYDEGDRRESLFNLENDPGEQNDLATDPSYSEVLEQHRIYLQNWSDQYEDPFFAKARVLNAITIASAPAVNSQEKNNTITVGPEIQVGMDGASTVFAFYNTTPESPDGKHIFHVRYKEEPADRYTFVSGELWVCDRNLKNYRLVTEIEAMLSHNGVEALWVDNHHIALYDNKQIRIVDIRSGNDILKKKIEADGISHNTHQGKIMYGVTKLKGKGAPGIYELDCFTEEVRVVKRLADCADVPLPSYLEKDKIAPVEDWRALHLQYSPDGKKLGCRFDIGEAPEMRLLGLCNMDGSDFVIRPKSLHFLWYDNASIVGHIRYDEQGNQPPPGKRFFLTRWDIDGKYLETIATIRGNHPAISPDRQLFAAETFYQTSPVILYLINKDSKIETLEIDHFDPHNIVWDRRFHTNPAFSRDGKRIYYSKPLNEKYNGTFYREIKIPAL